MPILGLILVSFCIAVSGSEAVPTFSIHNSSVPNVSYENDAVICLGEAYTLYPSDVDKRLEIFSKLFQIDHQVAGGWNVALACGGLYIPNEKYFVDINVNGGDGNSTSSGIIKIYN